MMSITNGVTPAKLNDKAKNMGRLVGIGVINNLQQNPQVLQNHRQMGSRKHLFYQNQTPGIKRSLIG